MQGLKGNAYDKKTLLAGLESVPPSVFPKGCEMRVFRKEETVRIIFSWDTMKWIELVNFLVDNKDIILEEDTLKPLQLLCKEICGGKVV